MGVKGLSSYLREHKHKLSYTLELTSNDSRLRAVGADETRSEVDDVRVIVDGWS
jgi:hypothetical protein